MNEELNEKAYGKGLVVRGKHWMTIVNSTYAARVERDLVQKMTISPWLFFTPADDISFETWSRKYKMKVRDNLNHYIY